ncbi:MAG: hypothetical protein ABI321_18145 [Polyangia bacterium]
MRTRLAAALATLALLCSLSAHAQTIRAAAMPPILKSGGSTPELRDKFHETIVQGLGTLSGPSGPNGELGDVLGASDTRALLGEELMGCGNDVACVSRAATALKVNRLITTELTVAGKSYSITMRLYDGAGKELTHTTELCEICTVREAEAAMTKTSAHLAVAARTFPVEAVTMPKEERKPPVVEEKPPQPSPYVSPMQAAPTIVYPAPEPRHKYVPWKTYGFAAIGVAIVGLAVGVPLLVIDGRPTCSTLNPSVNCPRIYHTRAGGAVMTTIGVLGVVAAIPLFVLDDRDHKREPMMIGLQTQQGGGQLVVRGSF